MPAESKRKQLVLALLSLEKKPLSSSQLAQLLGKSDTNTINLVRHDLLNFWKKGVIVRSEKEIGLEYYYYFGTKKQESTLFNQKVAFSAYSEKKNSRNLKAQIKAILEQNGPLTVKEVCAQLTSNFDLDFLKKINFHLQDLYKKQEVLRLSKPYQYYVPPQDAQKVSTTKASIPTLLLSIIQEKKTAQFTSELVQELEQRGITPKLSTVSIALQRLCRQQILVSSKTKFGTRSSKTGYLWALDATKITRRFWQELPVGIPELLTAKTVSVREICNVLKVSPANALRTMERVARELPEFIVEKKHLVKRPSEDHETT
ncbi:TPA: hypothetical protein HA242_06750 [Candidatus Woesearchaeota archaeon]|nr:hypothetical protein [Candidatus Woesearchaeota archaeon]HIG92807.1 hypothetical protein [Candidatus Woesearchaeota archaeon]HIH13393.1 hypothetical protein [Candidatus Woesearchaeota archaeon]